jgi:hypothetical protein
MSHRGIRYLDYYCAIGTASYHARCSRATWHVTARATCLRKTRSKEFD